MAKIQHGLGKGLGALLGDDASDLREIRKPVDYINREVAAATPKQDTADVLRVSVDLIEPNPFQPRVNFDPDALQELADSIRNTGLIQPVTVRKNGAKYQIISGERRYRASILAGMDRIPAYVMEVDDKRMLEMAIVENIQRENLDPIELATSYQRLMEECALTQEQLSDRIGKKRASVANQLRLLRLPERVQQDIKAGRLSVGHAKVLLGVEDPKLQEQLCAQTVRKELSVRQLEEKVRALRKESVPEKEPDELPDMYYRLLEKVGRYFGENISLRRNAAGKGSITIKFDSDEQMERFLQALDHERGL
jgi:ParB family chromosome partitioning protein